MSAEAAVLNKVFEILRRELSTEEYLTYLRMVTPRIGDATKELREKTKDLCLDEVIEGVREIEKGDDKIKMRAKIIALGIALVFLLSASAGMLPHCQIQAVGIGDITRR